MDQELQEKAEKLRAIIRPKYEIHLRLADSVESHRKSKKPKIKKAYWEYEFEGAQAEVRRIKNLMEEGKADAWVEAYYGFRSLISVELIEVYHYEHWLE